MTYRDLNLVEWSTTDLVARARDNLAMAFPELALTEGSLEALLLEQFAVMTSEAIWAANRAPAVVMESLLLLFGLTRDPGAQAQVEFRFTLSGTGSTRTIPAATRVLVGGNLFYTDSELVVDGEQSTGTVTATSEDLTAGMNGVSGLTATLLDAVAYAESVEVVGTPHDGRDPEELASYLDRGSNTLSNLTSTLVRAEQFATAALADTAVSRALAIDLYDPLASPPTDRPGHLTVAVLGQDGALLTDTQKASLRDKLAAQAVAILTIHVVDAALQQVDVEVDIHPMTGYTSAQVKSNIRDALSRYLDATQWSYGGSVYWTELVSLIDRVPGVDRVITLTSPGADVPMPSTGALAKLGNLTVKVDGVTVL